MEYIDFSRELRQRLLARLESRLHEERPDLVDLFRELQAADAFDGDRWGRAWEKPIQPEVGLLTALYDLTKGLRSLEFVLERVRITTDSHEWDFVTRYESVAHAAVLDRIEDLLKRFGRSRLVDDGIVVPFMEELDRHRRDDSGSAFPFLQLRHETAHTAQRHPRSVNRAAENAGLWELLALEGMMDDPSEWVRLPTTVGRDRLYVECRDAFRNVQGLSSRICESLLAAIR